MRGAGHHDRRDQERLRADRRRTRPGPCGSPPRSPTETTFLGAHVVPAEYADRADDYVDLVTGPMLAACAPHARWIDVFCEPAARTLRRRPGPRRPDAGRAARPGPAGARQPARAGPGVQLAVELGAASADHCTHLTDADVDALAGGTTVATLLPGVEFSTRSPYPDARRLLDAGVTVALATDCNPGSLLHLLDAVLHRARRPRDGHDPGRGAVVGDRGRGARRCAATTSGTSASGPAPTSPCSTRRRYVHLAYRPGVPLVRVLDLGVTWGRLAACAR